MAAFVPAAPLSGASFSGPNALCVRTTSTTVPATVIMRCRRDLKKEKAQRNLEFARSHRKKVVRNFNRRAEQTEKANLDNEYLSSVFGTIRFGWKEGDADVEGKTNDWRGSQIRSNNRGGGRAGGGGGPRKPRN